MDSELLWGPGLVGPALPMGLSRAMVETREVSKLLMSTDYLSKCCIHTACIHADMAGAPHYGSGPSLTAQGAEAKKRTSGHNL